MMTFEEIYIEHCSTIKNWNVDTDWKKIDGVKLLMGEAKNYDVRWSEEKPMTDGEKLEDVTSDETKLVDSDVMKL